MVRLGDVTSTVRSKNAGPDCITFDIIFKDADVYERVKASGALTPERICQLYGIHPERLVHFTAFDPAQAFKFTIRRVRPSGSPGETDVMGSQMYAPLLDLELPATVLPQSTPAA
ncbi:MAG: acyl-CoA synthetase [Firmicutes bacterium ZCTH02-B6]|nr:MAG: acyl-CoA synthetase [Firmicutes bacterium ZCTH02-B6]